MDTLNDNEVVKNQQFTQQNINLQISILKGIMDTIKSPFFSVDKAFTYTSFNKEHAGIMKLLYNADIVLNNNLLDYMTVKEDRDSARSNLSKAMNGEYLVEEGFSGEEQYARLFFEVTHTPILNEENDIIGVAVMARDITARKRAENAFHETRDYLENLITYANAPIIVWDSNYKVTKFNRAFERITGRCSEEMIGKSLDLLFPEKSRTDSMNHIYQTGTGERWETVEIEIQNNDGTIKTVLWNSANILDPENKQIIATIAQGNDITDRKLVEKALRESEEKFRNLFENSPIGKSMTGIDGSLYVNKTFSEIVGYSQKELIDKNWKEISHPDEILKTSEIIQSLLDKKVTKARFEKRYLHKNGHIVWTDVSTYLQRDKEDNPQFFITNILDISNQKEAEREIKHLNLLYDVLSQCNQAIVRVQDKSQLFREICNIAVTRGQFRMAWIGTLDAATQSLEPNTWSGVEDGFLKEIFSDMTQAKQNKLPCFMAINEEKTVVVNNIETDKDSLVWRESALRRKYNSLASTPIRTRGIISGILVLYSTETDFFSEKEISLIDEIALDISFALDTYEQERQRKISEGNLQKSEARLRRIYESGLLGIFYWNMDGQIVDSNDKFLEMTGYSRDDLKKGNIDWVNITPHEFRYLDDLSARELKATGANKIPFEKEYICKDGTRLPVIIAGAILDDENFNGVTIVLDITDRKHAEKKLSDSEEQFRTMANAMPQLAWIANADGYIFWYNQRWYEYSCTTPEQMEGWGWQSIHDPEVLPHVMQNWSGSIASGKPFEMEFPLRRADGVFRTFLTRVQPLIDSSGQVARWFGTNTDVEELKSAQYEIKKLNEELEKRVFERTSQLQAANIELEAFSYSVSHDLRAPLRHINGYIDLLKDRFPDSLPEKGKHYFNNISESAKEMGTLIDDLLQFSRTGREEMKMNDIDMKDILNDALKSIRLENSEREIKWIIKPLPKVRGDFNLLKMVWYNLLSNAIKFTKYNDKTIIEIGVNENDKEFEFYINDNGVGFEMEYANKLFGVFQRLHSTTEYEGTGIGLANVRRIILRHGGRTRAKGEPGKGATIYFSLPK